MPRWESDAQGRLERAALELFESQGFERTSVAQIAGAAGLKERQTLYSSAKSASDASSAV